ncbi:MAG TPA: HlyD family secretion protein [Stenotrophobium sp.]|jgi:membrane fusion protein (multidrug efflux system)|nr:HlyD family secretion protein [Stenotrophobium sp.]
MAAQIHRFRFFIIAAVVLVLAAGSYRWWTYSRFFESTDNAYVRADITVITPRVGGEIVELAVHDNQEVKKGDLLLKIDPRDYQARVADAQAMVAAGIAAVAANVEQKSAQAAQIEEARATLASAQADAARAQKDWQRARTLVDQGVATHQRLDNATAVRRSAQANVARADAGVKVAEQQSATLDADRKRLQAQLEAARAQQQLAELDLSSTELRAPIDGNVGDLGARLGARVAPGQRLLSLVPLAEVYVEANFKETQLTHMALGQPVSIEVDAFPAHDIRGHIDSLSPASGAEFSLLPPQNATGNFTKIVQRVPVKIRLDGDEGGLSGRLLPGMSVVATVDTRGQVPTVARLP